MEHVTSEEAAQRWDISRRRVQRLCEQGRIEGAERHGRIWFIPGVAQKPSDGRIGTARRLKVEPSAPAEVAGSGPGSEADHHRIPMPSGHAIHRPRLLEKMDPPGRRITYIHAAAGYGKTTLLAQHADRVGDVAWLTLNEQDNDEFLFLWRLEQAIRARLSPFDFHATDYIPFAGSETFIPAVLSALRRALGDRSLTLILDDCHAITGDAVSALLTGWIKDCPPGVALLMASRRELWSGCFRDWADGRITVLTEADLRFNEEEAGRLWGFFDEEAYAVTEGWALAIESYRMALLDNPEFPLSKASADQDIYRYLMDEIFGKLSLDVQRFLRATSRLLDLEVRMCNSVLGIRNAGQILEHLAHCNLFTLRVLDGHYRYHALFRAFLQQNDDGDGFETVPRVLRYCFDAGDYEQAARYAMLSGNAQQLQDCISADAERLLGNGRYTLLEEYFGFLSDRGAALEPGILLVKGRYLSSIGRFFEADQCLEAAMAELGAEDRAGYVKAITHKARILRNKVSFEESNRCLHDLLPLLDGQPLETWYEVMIEKIYNLAMMTRLPEAFDLADEMVDRCSAWGNLKVRAWFERYLTALHFFAGEVRDCIEEYEKSLSIPPAEQRFLKQHSVAAYAAKAYQMAGDEDRAFEILAAEVAELQSLGLYEDLCPVYLLYAEVLNAAAMQAILRGEHADQSLFCHYLGLAAEYARLNRTTQNFAVYGRVLHLSMILFFEPKKMERHMAELLPLLEDIPPFFRAVALWRIGNAINHAGGDLIAAKEYYLRCMDECQRAGCARLIGIMAGGELAGIYLSVGDKRAALSYAREFIEYSEESGHRYYFQDRTLFEPVLRLGLEHGIAPEYTRRMLAYGGYQIPKVYLHTLGGFYIASEEERDHPIKIRTKKARELLAYLLEHRRGAARERICADLWEESEADVVKLFHTRRGEIRKAFESLGAGNPIKYEDGVYRLDMTEVVCDLEAFLNAAAVFERQPTADSAQRVVDLYGGRYLDDLEALWAEGTRLRCEEIFQNASKVLAGRGTHNGRRLGHGAMSKELKYRRPAGLHPGGRLS